jgi:hypothetical protein
MLSACAAEPIPAKQFWVVYDGGGRVQAYKDRGVAYKEEGRVVVIDGVCASACTWLFQAPVCATENAKVGFHAPFLAFMTPFGPIPTNDPGDKEYSAAQTEAMVDAMPVAYKEFLRANKIPSAHENGGDISEMLWVEGQAAVKIFGKCSWLK